MSAVLPEPVSPAGASTPATARMRSGTAARLAGLPVTTLRVWERRYGVVAASKTESGQRLYSSHDVSRLKLLRQLSREGHAIGSIATLALDALQALAASSSEPALPGSASVRSVVVVGRSAAAAIEAAAGCDTRRVFDDLAQAESANPLPGGVDVLVVRLASLQPAMVDRTLALGTAWHAGATVVVYAFGTEAAGRSLRDAGITVRREPVTGRELAQLVQRAQKAQRVPTSASMHDSSAQPPSDADWPVAPRRFSDTALAALAELPSPVACECLRHVTEIVAQLAGFERYSDDCVSTAPTDAALHRHLSRTAGVARTLFEQALQRLVTEEGLGPTQAA